MKKVIILAMFSCLLACTPLVQKDQSPTQSYRLKGSDEALSISGSFVSTYDGLTGRIAGRELTIKINSEVALKGQMAADASGHASSKWRTHFVETDCTSKFISKVQMDVKCTVLIDNERAAVLTF